MNNKKLNILFLGAGKKISLIERFISAGLEIGFNLNLFSYEKTLDVAVSKYCTIIVGKKWNDSEAVTDIKNQLVHNSIDIIVTCVDPAIMLAAKLKDTEIDVFIPSSSKEMCEITYDKSKANEWFDKIGVLIPQKTGHFPSIAKPKKGSASQGIYILNNELDEKYFLEKENSSQYIIQEFIEGDEYTVDAYVNRNREIVGIIPRIRLEVIGGESIKSITKRNEQIISITEKILSSGEFVGPITLQFIISHENNLPYLIEINPRLGGGVINSIEAGLNIPLFILKDSLNMPVDKINKWKENLLMARGYSEVFICK